MASFFFPLLWLTPEFPGDVCGSDTIRVHKRKWDVAIFDLYSLQAENHPLRLPPELMHIFLQSVYIEVEVIADDFQAAKDQLDCFRAMLYLRGTVPTVAPFASNMSLNSYAGINARSSGRQATLHEGLREGITHATGRVETWANEVVFVCLQGPQGARVRKVSEGVILGVTVDVTLWQAIEQAQPDIRAARRALVNAPLMPDYGTSVLHIWQGIESLFPSISMEISFRASLLLAELLSSLRSRTETYEAAKKSYGDRSRIAHGSQKPVSDAQWARAWGLLQDSLQSILLERGLADEETLIGRVLAS